MQILGDLAQTTNEAWLPSPRLALIDGRLCQWWSCMNGPRYGCGEWRMVPNVTRREAESDGPVVDWCGT